MTTDTFMPTIAVDFDGVINPYSRGWQGGELYERETTPGFWEWLDSVSDHCKVVIHSSRFAEPAGLTAAALWLKGAWERAGKPCLAAFDALAFSATKPPAWLTIDDRCVRFDGDWAAPDLQPEVMLAFKPWTQRGAKP